MFLLLLALPFALIFLVIFAQSGSKADWRETLLSTSVIWTAFLFGITEILSAFDSLTLHGLVGAWAAVLAGSTLLFLTHPTLPKFPRLSMRGASSSLERTMLLGIALIVLATCIIALTAPPNTWDSMTYHMSRVIHWIQNRNVNHYLTNIGVQNFLPSLDEYVIMHLQLLVGHDRFANTVQWFAMISAAVGLSLIARHLGARLPAQLLAAFLGVTVPMGILQSTSTQNDYFNCFWLVALSYYLFRLREASTWPYATMSGLSLGLAWATKPTSYLYAAPFLAVAAWAVLRNARLKGLYRLALLGAIAVVLNLPPFARNINTFGHPFGPPSYSEINRNEIMTPTSIASNLVRNIALHLAMPLGAINQRTEKAIDAVHGILGIDVNDIRTTFPGTKFRIVFANHEDLAGNLAHLILLFACGFLLCSLRREGAPARLCLIHFACVASSLVLLCAFIRWNPWNSRYHLALYLLATPAMAVVLERSLSHNRLKWLVLLLFIGSLPWVFYNFSRPLVTYPFTWKENPFLAQVFEGDKNIFTTTRTDQYFSNQWGIRDSYVRTADYLAARGVKKIGIDLGGNDWEYPFFPLLKERTQAPVRIEHVIRRIGSDKDKAVTTKGFVPEAIICLKPDPGDMLLLGETRYQRAEGFGPVQIFLPDS